MASNFSIVGHSPVWVNRIGEDITIATMSEVDELPCDECGQPFLSHFSWATFRAVDRSIVGPLVAELPPEGEDDSHLSRDIL